MAHVRLVLAAVVLGSVVASAQTPMGTAFTYQGRLTDNGSAATGTYDLQFVLYAAATGGTQVGAIVTLDDVTVSGGAFSVTLDFGATAFTGQARWLEVSVRAGASTGPFVVLSPRQELTPTPNALFSQRTPWTGLIGIPTDFADGLDDDILSDLRCASGQVPKWSGSAWACAADANSGGTVSQVATGAGLTGGPVLTTGTLSVATGGIATSMLADGAVASTKIATGAVGSAQIANGAVGLAQVNANQVQARVLWVCSAGEYLRGINQDGTPLCEPVPLPFLIAGLVDRPSGSRVGQYTSITAGTGFPIISYYDATAGALKVAACGNAACTGAETTITTVDDQPVNVVGSYTSMALGNDGLPVISYLGETIGSLKVAHCGNASCSSGNSITVLDTDAKATSTSIARGSDNLPVIAYSTGLGALRVAHCGDFSCTSGNTLTTVANGRNSAASLAVPPYDHSTEACDGLPVISFSTDDTGVLMVAKCGNAACSAVSGRTVVDSPGYFVGGYTSIAIDRNTCLPVIAYYAGEIGALKVVRCGNVDCSSGNSTAIVDSAPPNDVGSHAALVIPAGTGETPIISYHDATAGALKVVKCGNSACTAGNLITTVDDPANQVGQFTAIAVANTGLPVISYYDATAGGLKVAKCGTRTCQ